MAQRRPFPFSEFEPKWQAHWLESGAFRAPSPEEPGFDASKPKFYVLDMFPYPSGDGLHIGHALQKTACDILVRKRRMQGWNVLFPAGWDSFGLPAEQYAVKTGQHPRVTTQKNIANFTRQLKQLGFSYDWSREIATSDPAYFKWTQWIFLKIYNSYFDEQEGKARPIEQLPIPDDIRARGENAVQDYIDSKRLAYVDEQPVNWSPDLGTVLANEEVEEWTGKGFRVERRPMRQWMLRIRAFAQRLLDDLRLLDWPESLKQMQRNWIGRSEGAMVEFSIEKSGEGFQPVSAGEDRLEADATIGVFTTRPDTLFGATYMVLAPEHPLVERIVSEEHWPAVREYREKTSRKSDLERTELAKEKTGVFTGAFAVNPVNGEKIPIWIADYVLLGYGTGAIMAVPAHDERDFEFAKKYGLEIRQVVRSGIGFQPMDPQAPVTIRQGAHLPHWSQTGATYAVTFRLADSLPAPALQEIEAERALLEQRMRSETELSSKDRASMQRMFSEKVEGYLDAGYGACRLRNPEVAEAVANALRHFDGQRYDLIAWCVMPNHVHVIVRPREGHSLSEILHSWKSFTANAANKILGRSGEFWQEESYDHLLRDRTDLNEQVRYIRENPVRAGVGDWKWVEVRGDRLEADATDADATELPFAGDGVAVNSEFLDGLPTVDAKKRITAWLEENGLGRGMVNYKLRDWLFSRQRYWGEPFPIIWKDGRHYPLSENDLPLLPPEMEDFKPAGDGRPPLAKAREWVELPDGSERETNTMPQWAGSCWYYLRYLDPNNADALVDPALEHYWMQSHGVDLYVGGVEHAVLHLLYARFWHKVLFDLGCVSTPEPFHRLVNQGLILGEDNQKMSKSRGNVINPDEIVGDYGADALRLFEMFMGPLEQMKPWSMKGVEGVFRFLARVWRLGFEENQEGEWTFAPALAEVELTPKQLKVAHATIRKVTEGVESLSFNTAIAQMMIFVNEFTNTEPRPVEALRILLRLLSPFSPHLAEEMWMRLAEKFAGFDGLASQAEWPEFDEKYLIEDEVELAVQVNGKLRDKIVVAPSATRGEIEAAALTTQKVAEGCEGRTVVKVIVVPGKLVNVVVR